MLSVFCVLGTVASLLAVVDCNLLRSVLYIFSWMLSMFSNCVANVRSAFLTGSPEDKLGVVVDGGFFSISTISVDA